MIHSLTVENFRAIRGTREYELPAGVIAFIGHNERGKTSSLLALAFAFYGSQAMPDGIDSADLINDHAAALRVAVRFDHKGDAYDLERTQRRDGRGDATLTRNGAPLASGRAAVTQAITQLFGVDHVGFMVSVFARQDELDALAGKRGAERVTTMLRLLGVEQADAAVKAIRKDANDERRSLELLRAGVGDAAALTQQRSEAESALAAQRAEAATARYDEAAHVTKISEIEEELAGLAPKRQAYEAWRSESSAAQSVFAAADARLTAAIAATTRATPVEPQVPELIAVDTVDPAKLAEVDAAYQAKREEWAGVDAELGRLRAERDNLTDTCAACGRPFDNAEQVAAHRSELTARIEKLEGDLVQRQEEGEAARSTRDALHAEAHAAQAADEANARARATHEQALLDHKRRLEEASQADGRLAIATEERDAAQQALDALVEPVDPTAAEARIRDALDDARAALTAVQLRLATLNAAITSGQEHVARLDADLARAKEKADAITAAERRVVTLDVAAREMAAMKERLIARVIPELEHRASALVADLTDGKHTELRLTSDYEIQYVTETGGVRAFGSLSGGAQDLFALALRLAIAELRAGSVPFLVLDEVFESLDDERQALAWAAIEHLGRRYAQVLVVTHVAALRERAATVVSV